MEWNIRNLGGLQFMVGKIPTHIWQKGEDELYFAFSDGLVVKFHHDQDCCECVEIEDVVGDWNDLVGHPLLVADVRTDESSPKTEGSFDDDSTTWTFYTFRNQGGSVDVRWYGTSNGYYSERVDVASAMWDGTFSIGTFGPHEVMQ